MSVKMKSILESERAAPVVNALFLLALLLQRSWILMLADVLWLTYLIFCMKRTRSKGMKAFYVVLSVCVGVILAVNTRACLSAYMY